MCKGYHCQPHKAPGRDTGTTHDRTSCNLAIHYHGSIYSTPPRSTPTFHTNSSYIPSRKDITKTISTTLLSQPQKTRMKLLDFIHILSLVITTMALALPVTPRDTVEASIYISGVCDRMHRTCVQVSLSQYSPLLLQLSIKAVENADSVAGLHKPTPRLCYLQHIYLLGVHLHSTRRGRSWRNNVCR